MQRLCSTAFAMAVAVLAGGCGAPRIDSSTPQTMAATLKKARASLPAEKRQKFDEAVMVVSLKEVAGAGLSALATQSPAQLPARASAKLHGKTALEIIAEADAIGAERAVRERAQALSEIKELETKRERTAAVRVELRKFEVSRSRLHLVPQPFGRPRPVIEISVKNGMNDTVARAYFKGTVASPGRAVPWIKEDFSYQIAGGVEPGETADWSLAPSPFGAWGKADVPKDAIFTVEVVKLDGPDGQVLYDSVFSDDDAERLEQLRASFR